jgi:hypothetical protein
MCGRYRLTRRLPGIGSYGWQVAKARAKAMLGPELLRLSDQKLQLEDPEA